MKKTTSILLALTLLLTACDNSAKSSERISISESSTVSKKEHLTSTDGENLSLESMTISNAEQQTSTNEGNISESNDHEVTQSGDLKEIYSGEWSVYTKYAATNDGLYTLSSEIIDKQSHLTYIDFATHQEVVLCADSSCKHDNEKCTAWLSKDEYSPKLFVYGNYLYMLCIDFDQENSFEYRYENPDLPPAVVETRKNSLYRMNLDGTCREKLFDFPEGDAVESYVIGDGDNLWFITKTPYIYTENDDGRMYNTSKNRALMKYSLKDRDFTERIPLDEIDNVKPQFCGVYKNKFIFGGTAYPDGKRPEDFFDILAPEPGDTIGLSQEQKDKQDELYKKCERVYFTLNRDNKSLNEVYRGNYMTSRGECRDGYIYLRNSDYSEFRVNIETGERENVTIPEGYRLDGEISGRKCYTRITPDWSDEAIYFDDLNGGLTKCDWWSWKCSIVAVCGDKAFIVYDCIGEEQPDGSIHNGKYQYAVITLDDLFGGKKNYQPITLIGG